MGETQRVTAAADNQSTQAYFVLGMGVLAVSLAAILIRMAQDETMPSIVIAGGRLLIAALVLTPALLRRPQYVQQIRQLNRRDFVLAMVSGFFLAMHFASWVTSLEYTTVLISVVLVVTTPIWVGLLEVFFLNARLSRAIIIGLVIALVGGLIIGLSGDVNDAVNSNDQIIGAALSLIGALTVSVYLVIGRKLRKQLALTPYVWLVYSCAAAVIAVIILFSGESVVGYSIDGYLWVLALGLIPQLIGHSSLNYALAYLPATYVSMATQLEPLMSALIAYFVFTEIPTEGQIVGGLVIMVGVTLATWAQRDTG